MNGRVGPREEMVVPVDVSWTAEVNMEHKLPAGHKKVPCTHVPLNGQIT